MRSLKRLRTKRMFRQAKSYRSGSRGQIVDAVSIRQRPAEIEDRIIPGALGRRSDYWGRQQRHRNSSRASFPICRIVQG